MIDDLYTLTGPHDLDMQGLLQAVSHAITERDQLRAELAAAVAERDRAIAAWDRSQKAHREDTMRLCNQNDELRARLAAIDNAPTVGWIADSGELIARPAKEAK